MKMQMTKCDNTDEFTFQIEVQTLHESAGFIKSHMHDMLQFDLYGDLNLLNGRTSQKCESPAVIERTHTRDVAIQPEIVAYHVKKYDNVAVSGQK